MEFQKTIAKPVTLTGVGLHTGARVTVTLKPAQPNTGIRFKRIDVAGAPEVPALFRFCLDPASRPRRTSIGTGGVEIHTVEHLMAALSGEGIDNATVELDGPEVPGLDGSSLPFVEAIKRSGIAVSQAPKSPWVVSEPVWVEEGASFLGVVPADSFKVSYMLSYDHPLLRSQYRSVLLNGSEVFERELAPARTFVMEKEAQALIGMGLGRGANYENTLVLGAGGVIQNKLRFEDEFVRHKIMDLVGDLYLLGRPLQGHVISIKSGHTLNYRLLKKLEGSGIGGRGSGGIGDRGGGAAERKESVILTLSAAKGKNLGLDPSPAFGGLRMTPKIGAQDDTTHSSDPPDPEPNPGKDPEPEQVQGPLDILEIQKFLPHRYPFLLIDRIVEMVPEKRCVGIKNVTFNEEFFQGHFPGRPVMPGVLIIESMAQCAGVLMLQRKQNRGKLAFFMSIDKAKFRRAVVPGDQLRIEIEILRFKTKTGQVRATAHVGAALVAEAELMFSFVD